MKIDLGYKLTFTTPEPPEVPKGCVPMLVNDEDGNFFHLAFVPDGNPIVWDGKQWVLASIEQIKQAVDSYLRLKQVTNKKEPRT